MSELSGLGPKSRERLSRVLRATKGTITPKEVAKALGLTEKRSSILLSYWNKQGWVKRVQRGLYIPIPIEASSKDISIEDPWLIAMRLYAPCYVGGWSAVEYWDFTEQIFNSVMVITSKRPNNRNPNIDGINFKLKSIPKEKIFGLKTEWRGKAKVKISDPSRTMTDLFVDPSIGGGIRPVRDAFKNYLKSKNKNINLLIKYCKQLKSGTAFKRLGLLLEMDAPEELDAIRICKKNITQGYSKIDPSLKCEKIITRWRLRIPTSWSKELSK
ncbi:type IV toxin-antitoxin system AbiEi family antitoxin domain-containing protein [Bdellovibrionales bacterium]|nr:type IV toxin-antitoxin system AbiEi family antitoxin domain-containing protein [Bdellovibrionales bacterium]